MFIRGEGVEGMEERIEAIKKNIIERTQMLERREVKEEERKKMIKEGTRGSRKAVR